jgi:Mrp family chromosome partitioning ATPase
MTHFTGVSDLDGTAAPGWNRAGLYHETFDSQGSDANDTLRTFNALRRHQKQAAKIAESQAENLPPDSFMRTLRLNIQSWVETRRTETALKQERRQRASSRLEPAAPVALGDAPFVPRAFVPELDATPELSAPAAGRVFGRLRRDVEMLDLPVERSVVADLPAPVVQPEARAEIPALPPLVGVQRQAEISPRTQPEAAAQRLERLFGRLRPQDTDLPAPAVPRIAVPEPGELTAPAALAPPDESISTAEIAPLNDAPLAIKALEIVAPPIAMPSRLAIHQIAEPERGSAPVLERHQDDAEVDQDIAEIIQPLTSVIETAPAPIEALLPASLPSVEQARDWIRPAVAAPVPEMPGFLKAPPLAYSATAAQPKLRPAAIDSVQKEHRFSLSNTVHSVVNMAMQFVRSPSSKRARTSTTPRSGDPSFLGLQKRSDIIGAVNPIDTLYGFIRSMLRERQTGLVLHVVSASHGEGTTTIARALAERATTVGHRRVLLIGMNTVPGSNDVCEGLLSFIDRGQSVEGAIYETPGTSLARASLLGPTEQKTTDTKAVREAYQACRELYELCIVDCPPIADGTYFDLVPEDSDGIIFIVQAEKLRPAVIQRVKDMLEQQGGNILGIVLNQTKHYIPKVIYKLL